MRKQDHEKWGSTATSTEAPAWNESYALSNFLWTNCAGNCVMNGKTVPPPMPTSRQEPWFRPSPGELSCEIAFPMMNTEVFRSRDEQSMK